MTTISPANNYLFLYPNTPVFYLMLTSERQSNLILCKIGVTERLQERHRELENQSGRWLRVIHCMPCSTIEEAKGIEMALKSILRHCRKRGEYYFLYAAQIDWIKKIEKPKDIITLWSNGEIEKSSRENRRMIIDAAG